MEPFKNPEEKITCPYDDSHFIRRNRMTVHLVKCRANHQDAQMGICDFNTNHILPIPELRYHHEICPDRIKIEGAIMNIGEPDSTEVYPIKKVEVSDEDSWDDDYPGYDPTVYCEKSNVVRNLSVKSSAIRRNFRVEERERLDKFQGKEAKRDEDSGVTYCLGNEERAGPSGYRPRVNNNRPVEDAEVDPASWGAQAAQVEEEEEAPDISISNRIKTGSKKTYEAQKKGRKR